jgi:hypothetical protein
MSFFDTLVNKIQNIKEDISNNSEEIMNKIKEKGTKLMNKIKSKGEIIIDKVDEGKNFIVKKFETGIEEIKNKIENNSNNNQDLLDDNINKNEYDYDLYDEYPNIKENKKIKNNEYKNYKNYDEIFKDGIIQKPKIEDNWGICPITNCYMENPVLTPSGQYYEKNAILKWLEKNKTDPVTREYLSKEMLLEDLDFKREIEEYKFINDIE